MWRSGSLENVLEVARWVAGVTLEVLKWWVSVRRGWEPLSWKNMLDLSTPSLSLSL